MEVCNLYLWSRLGCLAFEWTQIDWHAYPSVPVHVVYISLFCFLVTFRYFQLCTVNTFNLLRETERLAKLKSEMKGSLHWVNLLKRHSVTVENRRQGKKHQTWNKMSSTQKSWFWSDFCLAPEFLCVLVSFSLLLLIFPTEKLLKCLLYLPSYYKFYSLCISNSFTIPRFP